jgi:myo-inositol-1(or 4)-monophosphatase
MNYLNEKSLFDLKNLINDEFKKFYSSNLLNTKRKEDHSLITDLDLSISALVKKYFEKSTELTFFSEEENSGLRFPCIILDPIDGTRDLTKGYRECAVSLAIVKNDNLDGEAWIYNPLTGFSISTVDNFAPEKKQVAAPFLGLTSRSEFEKGLHANRKAVSFCLMPKGSIAFKLGLLAAGSCDFVYTANGKSLWDIAAGLILCRSHGINCYHKNSEIRQFDKERYDGPFLWAHSEVYKEINEHFA